MADATPRSNGASPLARQLAAAWAEAELSAALATGARLLAEMSGARVSALFVLTDEGIGTEVWYPEMKPHDLERRIRFQRAALEGTNPKPGPGPVLTRALRLQIPPVAPAHDRPTAALAWVHEKPAGAAKGAAGTAAEREAAAAAEAEAEAALELLAWKVASMRDTARHHSRQEQYERWFKTFDAQLRILDRERQKFAAVANQADTYAFVTDASRTIQWVNKAMASWVGGEAESGWTGRACADLCGPVGLKSAHETCDECPVRRAFDGNATVHREVSRTPGGRELYLTALPIKGPDGRPIEVLAQLQDLTNLEVVRRAKERLETVVSGAPIVLFSVDLDGIYTLSEGRGLEALGRKPGQVIGESIYDVYRDYPAACDCIRRGLQGETVTDSVDIGPLSFEVFAGPLRGPDGSIEGVIGVATNVTERRCAERALSESEEKLRHAQRLEAIGSLAGGVAHDFNNLLTAMFGHLSLLRGRLGAAADLHGEVDAIERGANRAAALTRQLLAFSRKQVQQLRVVDLNSVVRETEPMLRRLIREDIELLVRTDAGRPWIRVDVGQMEQVIVNLVVNACDAMPRGGRLTVSTSDVEGATVALVVRDTGCGMNEEIRSRAFEPFFTTKPVGEGTGLGLSTVYGIVKQSDGEVLLESAPDQGTTFTLHFPRTEAPSGSERAERRVATLVPGHETILLVEDEPMVRELFRDVLLEAGYTVLEAKNGMEALEIACRHAERIHLMVTDVVMPGMTGGELVRRMGLTRPEVKVLYVSGYTDDVLVRRGVIESGVNFLQKPCMPDDLSRVVRDILG
jgi:signal transduction histidine kinase